jgi:hypothetical protein
MNDLILCPACRRHVRPTEARCPFCAASIDRTAVASPPPPASRGLSRARLYAIHAAVATGVAACGGTVASPTSSSGADAASDSSGLADSKAIDSQSGVDAPSGDVQDTGAGLPDASDASEASSAEASADSGSQDARPDILIAPPYGCVFPGGCVDVIV